MEGKEANDCVCHCGVVFSFSIPFLIPVTTVYNNSNSTGCFLLLTSPTLLSSLCWIKSDTHN